MGPDSSEYLQQSFIDVCLPFRTATIFQSVLQQLSFLGNSCSENERKYLNFISGIEAYFMSTTYGVCGMSPYSLTLNRC
jgi:hypothetical protein